MQIKNIAPIANFIKKRGKKMNGKIIFTSKDHDRIEREIFPALHVPRAARLTAGGEANEGFMGFGVAITPSSCYELSLMEPAERRALIEDVFTKKGLNLSVARLCIGSSDYSPEIYSYDDVAGDVSLTHFSVARDEKYVIPMIREILAVRPDLYLFASPWSPPYWMKTDGYMCGGYMRAKFVSCYADYIIKFIEAYAAHGIRISAITPQNEPNNDHGASMPGCLWHPEIEADFVLDLKTKLCKKGLDVKVWILDHAFDATNRALWQLDNCEGLAEKCDGVAFHYYSGSIEQTKVLGEKYPQLALHFTEGGPRLTDNYETDYTKWVLMASKALHCGYKSFTGWNLMLDELGGPNVGPFLGICGGLITRDSRDGTLTYSGQYKAFMHLAPYITPQSKIYPLTTAPECAARCMSNFPKSRTPIEGILIENADQKIAVLVNPNEGGAQAEIELCGALYYIEMYGSSVATVIFDA